MLAVGLPAHMDGTEHEVSRLARKFARDLGLRFGVRIELVDERLTSATAESAMRESGVAARKHKGLVDQVAAQHILQDVRGISFTYFTAADVVRHPLVARIVEAYERAEKNDPLRPPPARMVQPLAGREPRRPYPSRSRLE